MNSVDYGSVLHMMPSGTAKYENKPRCIASKFPATKLDKGFKLYTPSHICNYKDMYLLTFAIDSRPERG